MKKLSSLTTIISLFLLFTTISAPIYSCTIFCASRDGKVLVGNNEDGFNTQTKIWFVPPAKDQFGYATWSYNDGFPQGGMNDQGLFFDGTANRKLPVTGSLHKPKINPKYLILQLLTTCATVDDALKHLDKYNLEDLKRSQLFLCDSSGNAVIVEGDKIVRKKKDHLWPPTSIIPM